MGSFRTELPAREGRSQTSMRSGRRAIAVLGALTVASALLTITCQGPAPRHGWSKAWGPMVPHGSFPKNNCGLCHVPERWDVLKPEFSYDHLKETGFALEGAHADAGCLRCHNDRGPVRGYVERGCGGCHPDVHGAKLGPDCVRCHEQTTWRPSGLIAEHSRTRFPLFGAHSATPCERCHERAPAGDFRSAPILCELCHRSDFARATNPDHNANGWTRDCQRCHTASSWTAADFNHNFFPLSGGHARLACTRCHISGTFGPIPSGCYSCHAVAYAAAPNHLTQNYSHDCTLCHSINGWIPSTFNHSFFPLTGGHASLACNRCHTSGALGPIPSGCSSCHLADYQAAPNHAALGFSQDCARCHTTTSFTPSTFNHRFPISGPHNVACSVCHDAGSTQVFTCIVCHEHRQSAMDAKHSQVGGYSYTSTACYNCHPNGRN